MVDFHPIADIFPLMEDGSPEFEELVKDIDANGLTDPVVLYEGMILDGRNRYRACQKLGLPHREIKFEDLRYGSDNPITWVWSKNYIRRQLTPGQRDMAAQKLEQLTGSGRPSKASAGVKTRKQIAAATGASEKGLERAKRVRDKGLPKVVKAVESGTIALHTADRISRLPEADQEEIMAAPKPAEAVAQKETTAARRPAKRGGVGPAVTMKGQMTGSQSGIRDVQLIGKFWEENKGKIKGLNKTELRTFIRDLEESRAAASRLLHLIEAEILPEWTLPGKKPALLSTALNKIDQAAKDTKGS